MGLGPGDGRHLTFVTPDLVRGPPGRQGGASGSSLSLAAEWTRTKSGVTDGVGRVSCFKGLHLWHRPEPRITAIRSANGAGMEA
jgi:hypothetical protein